MRRWVVVVSATLWAGCSHEPPPSVLQDPARSSAAVVSSAAPSSIEGGVLALYEVDDTIDPFDAVEPSSWPSGVDRFPHQAADGLRTGLLVVDEPGARARLEQATKALSHLIPGGRTLAWEHLGEAQVDRPHFRSVLLGPRFLTERNVTAATLEKRGLATVVTLEVDDAGRKAVAAATSRLVNGRMAILVFGEPFSVPDVMSKLDASSLLIGTKDPDEVPVLEKLVATLKR
jgi:hypothetical protein